MYVWQFVLFLYWDICLVIVLEILLLEEGVIVVIVIGDYVSCRGWWGRSLFRSHHQNVLGVS